MRWIGICWALFLLPFLVNHLLVRSRRSALPPENRIHRAPASDAGLFLQFLSLLIVFLFRSFERPSMLPATVILCLSSAAFAAHALHDLGRHWRIQAVITDDHELITTGAYSVVRHPVYLALLGMLAGTLLTTGTPLVTLVALPLYLAGTEIRVRAEDGLLQASFPESFPAYAARVRGYLPFLR